jgi:catechol 2,3-dioxygenase-like lactoylglutathione lyase family enzyme
VAAQPGELHRASIGDLVLSDPLIRAQGPAPRVTVGVPLCFDDDYLDVKTYFRGGGMITGFDHVQLAMPRGREEEARAFYAGLLGMAELAKPAALAPRGGCWFTSGAAVLHLGVEEPFAPARKAHPALLTDELDALEAALRAAGRDCVRADNEIPGVRRFHTHDPFGNRVEFQQAER